MSEYSHSLKLCGKRALHYNAALVFIYLSALFSGCVFDGTIVQYDLADTDRFSDDALPLDTSATGGKVPPVTSPADSDACVDTASAADTADVDSEIPPTDASSDSQSMDIIDHFPDNTAPWDWSFFSIADMQNGPVTGVNHIHSMALLDPNAAALIEVGDFTHYGSKTEWESHMTALKTGARDAGLSEDYFRTTATDFGNFIRVIGVLGNHEPWSSDWYQLWNEFLPGQKEQGVNSEDGVYFTLTHQNMLFILLDSNHTGDAQTNWLKEVLDSPEAGAARWKIAFFHEPVYSCNSKSPLAGGLPWVSLFEEHKVDLVVHGHAHTFEQTCPMREGRCVGPKDHGVVYLTASGGGTSYLRSVHKDYRGNVTYKDRSDDYDCAQILQASDSSWHHFCHYAVTDRALTVRCFDHDYWSGGKLRHQFEVEKND